MSVKGLESLKKYIQKNLLFDIIHTHFLSYNSDRELFLVLGSVAIYVMRLKSKQWYSVVN